MKFFRGRDYKTFPVHSIVALDDSLRPWLCPEIPSGWEDRVPWWGVHHSELQRLSPAEEAELREILGIPSGTVHAPGPEPEPLPDGSHRWVP